jgi:asparagine synthase (glutamine-hydrolysing)
MEPIRCVVSRAFFSLIQLTGVTLAAIDAMAATLNHRRPDGEGIWIDREGGIALGHRRLAIVDLTDAGHQPMLSEDEDLVMTFNGEVYNFATLRPGLKARGHRFRGPPPGTWPHGGSLPHPKRLIYLYNPVFRMIVVPM